MCSDNDFCIKLEKVLIFLNRITECIHRALHERVHRLSNSNIEGEVEKLLLQKNYVTTAKIIIFQNKRLKFSRHEK